MAFFTKEYLDFFKELAAHNNKEWFHEHKKRYADFVREPMKKFIAHMRDKLMVLEPNLKQLELKNALFRINNDIRFAKDKPLYKLHMAAVLTRGGRKEMHRPGFYFQLGPGESFIAGGSYMPQKEHLNLIREKIAQDPRAFYEIVNYPQFVSELGGLGSSKKNKRLPKEMNDLAKDHPILLNQQFYYMKHFEPEEMLKDDFDEFLLAKYRIAEPFRKYLKAAIDA